MATAQRATKLTMMATIMTMATGDNDDDGAMARQVMARWDTMTMTTMMATALWAIKLTMMATMTTMATGVNDKDGNGATGDGATGYNNNNDGNG